MIGYKSVHCGFSGLSEGQQGFRGLGVLHPACNWTRVDAMGSQASTPR